MPIAPGPKLDKDNNPGRAKWCDHHGRLECTKNSKQNKGPCHGPAIRGTDACKLHGGRRIDVARATGQARITAWSATGEPAEGAAIDPGMAVLGMLHMSWLRASAYGELLRRQVEKEQGGDPDHDGLQGGGGTPVGIETAGLIGYKFGAAGKEGHIYATNEEIRALVALEAAERDRVVKFAKTAHDLGISDRMTNLAERWGDLVISRIMLLIDGLNLTPEQQILVPGLVQLHLSQIDLGLTGGE